MKKWIEFGEKILNKAEDSAFRIVKKVHWECTEEIRAVTAYFGGGIESWRELPKYFQFYREKDAINMARSCTLYIEKMCLVDTFTCFDDMGSEAISSKMKLEVDVGITENIYKHASIFLQQDGIKYYVFTSGPHISPEEEESVFIEGYRGSESKSRPGTGHGLAFVKNAVELHGGHVGYEAVPDGNIFYFILPE